MSESDKAVIKGEKFGLKGSLYEKRKNSEAGGTRKLL